MGTRISSIVLSSFHYTPNKAEIFSSCSFDPITLGHLNIVRRTSRIFERVIVLAMVNANKSRPMFTLEERVDMIKRVVTQYGNVEVATYDGLLAEYGAAS